MAFYLRLFGLLGLVVLLAGCEDPNAGDFGRCTRGDCDGPSSPDGDDDDGEDGPWPDILGLDADGEAADVMFIGEAAEDRAGVSVVSLDDIDGDSTGELVVAAYLNDRSAELSGEPLDQAGGRVYVFLGGNLDLEADGTTSLGSADTIISSEIPNGYLGWQLANVDDLDGDGIDDLGISLHKAQGEESVFIFTGAQIAGGGELLLEDAFARIVNDGDIAETDLGQGFAGIGDVDGDGVADLAIGAPRIQPDGGEYEQGRIWIVPGSQVQGGGEMTVQSIALTTITGDFPSTRLGDFISPIGDIDGNGINDVAFGLPRWTNDDIQVNGAVYVFLDTSLTSGEELMAEEADSFITGSVADGRLGTSMAGVGDLDGDGFGEFVLGASTRVGANAAGPGSVYMFRGAGSLPSTMVADDADLVIEGTATEVLGHAMSGGLDIDFDGLGDLVVTAPNMTNGVSGAGGAYLFTGATLLGGMEDGIIGTGFAAAQFAGTQGNQSLGTSVAMVPDINGDRFDEILLGSQDFSPEGMFTAGAAYLILSRYTGPGEGN